MASARQWDTGRVEAFSDGVFAIAITLLVLDIRIEPTEYEHLARALLHEWPAYLAYVTSFLTVGTVWIAHHSLFHRLRFVDPVLLRINLLLLMAAAFLPFPTGVMAQAFHASDTAERVAIAVYGGTALVIELLLRAGVRYCARHPELTIDPEDEPAIQARLKRHRTRRELLVAGIYGAAIVFGIFAFPRVSAAAYLLIAFRSVLVVGSEGRLSLRALRHR